MRSFGPVPFTLDRSTPSSRANARTEGEAWALLNASLSIAAASRGARSMSAFSGGGGEGAEGCAAAGALVWLVVAACADGGAAGFAAATSPAAWSVRITLPSLTLSPTLSFNSWTTPAAGDGTSIVVLSDSSATSGSSGFTVSPAFTNTSMTGTSLKSPISGTLTSVA